MFSLLAEAAERIESGETCVELNKYEDPVFDAPRGNEGTASATTNTNNPPRDGGGRPKKQKSWINALKKRLDNIMSEDEDDEQ